MYMASRGRLAACNPPNEVGGNSRCLDAYYDTEGRLTVASGFGACAGRERMLATHAEPGGESGDEPVEQRGLQLRWGGEPDGGRGLYLRLGRGGAGDGGEWGDVQLRRGRSAAEQIPFGAAVLVRVRRRGAGGDGYEREHDERIYLFWRDAQGE